MEKNKKELIEMTIKEVSKKFGKDAIMLLNKNHKINVQTFSSGSLILDHLLGIGRIPKGKIIEIYGPESSGKTTLSLHTLREIQKIKGVGAFIDVEHSLDPNFAQKIGVETDDLIFCQPNSGEQALEIIDLLIKSNCVDLIVLDSVAALTPEVELEGQMSDQTIGLQARLMSRGLRKITNSLYNSKTTIIFINQLREKINSFGFGPNETTPGGKALKFYSSIRIEIKRTGNIKDNQDVKGIVVKMKVNKNKLASPFKVGSTNIYFENGINQLSELIDLSIEKKILDQKGSWISFNDKNLAQGKQNLIDILKSDQDLYRQIFEKLQAIF